MKLLTATGNDGDPLLTAAVTIVRLIAIASKTTRLRLRLYGQASASVLGLVPGPSLEAALCVLQPRTLGRLR